MNTSLTLNHKNQIALFYDEPFGFKPEWASIDVELGGIHIGGNEENKAIKLDKIDQRIYERVSTEAEILLVLVDKSDGRKPLEALSVALMVSQQF